MISCKILLAATASIVASHTDTYSASAVDNVIIDCRRDIQATAPPASVKTKPVVLFRCSGSFAQSLSLNPSSTTSYALPCCLK
ncbi:hypothetical protein PF003_g2914 [Phytophthora fragariae]|nr:hypothetical protein PF003_g2914 [Phytophthora fragariae]